MTAPTFTVLVPTFDHEDTIRHAIESIQWQTHAALEILVVGDGAPARTGEVLAEMARRDPRIRYFDNPKGEGNGELHRARALAEARGDFVAYLGDDDLWMPRHLQRLRAELEDHDFVHSTQAEIGTDGVITFRQGDLADGLLRQRLLDQRYNFFGPSTVVHRLDAYRRLPFGWATRPDGVWSDLHMWRQWLQQADMRFKTLQACTALHLGSVGRGGMTIAARCAEMRVWQDWIRRPGAEDRLVELQLKSWQERLRAAMPAKPFFPLLRDAAREGRHGDVVALASAILASGARPPPVCLWLGRSLLAQQQAASALNLLEDLRFDSVNEFQRQLVMAEIHLTMGHPEALSRLRALRSRPDPEAAVAYLQLARRFEKRGLHEEGLAAVEEAAYYDPDHPELGARRDKLAARVATTAVRKQDDASDATTTPDPGRS